MLETNQTPWAPSVVYVGALGVRGGMPPKKGKECIYEQSKWKQHGDGSKTCPSGQHRVAAPPKPSGSPSAPARTASPEPSARPSSFYTAPPAPYPIGGGISYDPVATGHNLGGLLKSLFGSNDRSYREDPSVQESIRRIKESDQELERLILAAACREHQRCAEEHARWEASIRASKEAWKKIYEDQGEEMKKKYCRQLSIGSIEMDIDSLRTNLADYPAVDSPLPRELEEDIHITLGYIAKEEEEFADFDRRMADIPPDGGTQWSADYYNRRGAARARIMLEEIKADLEAIIAERSAVLAHSEFTSVKEAVHRIEQARQAEGRTQVASGSPEHPAMAHAPATSTPAASVQAGEEADHKMPSLPRITTFTTLEEAQEAVKVFIERWNLETPSGREAIQEQGKTILQGVVALEETTRKSYEQQDLGFATQDVDPCVWNEVLQAQEITKAKLMAVIDLRGQLLHIRPLQLLAHPTQSSNVEDQAVVGSFPQEICESVASYRHACESDEAFSHQHIALTVLEAQLRYDPTNAMLAEQFKEQEAKFQQHALYQQGCALAIKAQKLREDALAKATPMLDKRAMQMGMTAEQLKQYDIYKKEAGAIKDRLLQPVRELLKRPSTPPLMQRAAHFSMGVGENAVDTAKLVINIGVLATKFLGGVVYSIATWKDKLGIGDKITDASEIVQAFLNKIKYEWENPEEFQARQKAAQRLRKELTIAEKALNAEAYHNSDAREMGYWSTEALQWVCFENIVPFPCKGSKTAKKVAKYVNKAEEIGSVLEIFGVPMDDAWSEDEERK